MRALLNKADQTKAAGGAWIWLEDSGALWLRTSFATSPLTDKVDTFVDALEDFFPNHPDYPAGHPAALNGG